MLPAHFGFSFPALPDELSQTMKDAHSNAEYLTEGNEDES